MKIYPDPELPDVTAIWFEGDCTEDATEVTVTLVDDDGNEAAMLRAPCLAATATFVDVPRKRFRVDGKLFNADGVEVITSESEVDLRAGLDEETYLSFFVSDNFTIGWTFDVGVDCSSLDAETVAVELASPDVPTPFVFEDICVFGRLANRVPEGTYTATMRAVDLTGATVATSPPTNPVVVDSFNFADFGVVVLTP